MAAVAKDQQRRLSLRLLSLLVRILLAPSMAVVREVKDEGRQVGGKVRRKVQLCSVLRHGFSRLVHRCRLRALPAPLRRALLERCALPFRILRLILR